MKYMSLILVTFFMLGTPALASGNDIIATKKHEYVEQSGKWKATCDKAPDVKGLFCRIMVIDKYMAGANQSFVHFGIAWAPDAMGLVIASYMGFKTESKVHIGVDKHERFVLPSSRGNTISAGPKVAEKLLGQLLEGNKIVLYFFPNTGVRHLSLVELVGFKNLYPKVMEQMKKQPE